MNIADLHTHPSLKPFNMHTYVPNEEVDMWRAYAENEEYLKQIPALIRGAIKETAKYSQANLNKMMKVNLRTAFFAIYPVERGMFDLTPENRKNSVQRFLLDLILKEKHYANLGAAVSGMPLEKVEKILASVNANQGIDYFEKETFAEYRFIASQSSKPSPDGHKFRIVSSYTQLKDIKDNHPDTIAAIMTIEGGHSLIHVAKNNHFYKTWEELAPVDQEKMRWSCLENVDRLKGVAGDSFTFKKEHIPFFMGLAHMFNNFLVGHAKTFGHGTLILPGTADLFDQTTGMSRGISKLGLEVIGRLLDRENGRRILIDIKHFSVQSREQFYRLLEEEYDTKGDRVPIIGSHVAVSGFENNDLSRKDTNCLNSGEYFNRWSVNFSNEDIRKIHLSGGILGMVPHEGTMPGPAFRKRMKDMSPKGRKEEYLKLFWSNIFQIVWAVDDKSAWDIISLGTDFDGLMDPFNAYPDKTYLAEMATDMIDYLDKAPELIVYKKNRQTKIKKDEIRQLKFGYDSTELVKKIFSENVERFLAKYFTKAYLELGPEDRPV